ncbi:MAG: NUDIX domain-containing protein [Pseudomonadota bacterium]
MTQSKQQLKQKSLVLDTLKAHMYCMQCAAPLVATLLDHEWRAACSSNDCEFVFWNNPTPVVAVLVEHLDEHGGSHGFVLAHNVLWQHPHYSVITGFLEADDESTVLSAQRETLEELNLHAVRHHYIGNYSNTSTNQLIIAYHVQAVGELKLNHELDDFKYIPLETMSGWSSETGQAVGDFVIQHTQGQVHYIEY